MTPPFDPLTFTMHSTLVWVRFWQAQQELWLRSVCAMTAAMPHQSAAELGAEAEKLRAPTARKPSARPARKAPAAQARDAVNA